MRLHTIPAGLPFLDTLAAHLLAGSDPLTLSSTLILLPNHRACRSLGEAFLRCSEGRPLLLPMMRSLDSEDEDPTLEVLDEITLQIPPAISGLERRLLLTRLVQAMESGRGGPPPSLDQAVRLAAALESLLDSVQIEQLSFDRLAKIVPDDHAAHWQLTVSFLSILTHAWPEILAERGLLDPQERINRILSARTEHWRANPPETPVIIAGSTGSRPATAELMRVVASLPQGMLVLPGLDTHLDYDSWHALEDSHPQAGMKRLLARLGVERRVVKPLTPHPDLRAARVRLLAEALRPAATCGDGAPPPEFPATTLEGVTLLEAPTPREEAGAIALLLRHTLETEGKTVALVTPDRALARRVAGELKRWSLVINDSAGDPLSSTVPGSFLHLLLHMVTENFAPHALLACLKHPLAAGGRDPAKFRAGIRRLERRILRDHRTRPGVGLAGLRHAVRMAEQESPPRGTSLEAWLGVVEKATASLVELMGRPTASLADLVRAHMEAAEALAANHHLPGPARLWSGEAGETLAAFAAELLDAALAERLPPFPPSDYPALFLELLAGRVSRRPWGSHPRLFLWGHLEARLQQADVMILAGLNEGVWPGDAPIDPWMSRPMRQTFGLPSPETRLGLSAHDFAQAFAAPQVVLSRSLRQDGTETAPSRWLLRLKTVMTIAKLTFAAPEYPWLAWYAALDTPEAFESPPQPPSPCPPVEARPRRLSVTEIETWKRDPYAIYARHVLGLRALDEIDQPLGVSDYGTLIHEVMERFVRETPGVLPGDAEQRLLALGEEVFRDVLRDINVQTFWWPRFVETARWLVEHEREYREGNVVVRSLCEVNGAMELQGPAGPFTLKVRADRLDLLDSGGVAIIDYKTGPAPSERQVEAGYAPQLPLEAAILKSGGFTDIPAGVEADLLLYWELRGGNSRERAAGNKPDDLAKEAIAGVMKLIAAFDAPDTPYPAVPAPSRAPKYSDTFHLARVKEWRTLDDAPEAG